MEKKKLYVGCSLTHAPEQFRSSVEVFKGDLRERGYEVFDFVGLVGGTPEGVYEWDIRHCVAKCDALIAICDKASIGLGWEMAVAVNRGIPVLAVAHNDTEITRLVLGAAAVEGNLSFVTYGAVISEILPSVDRLFEAS